MMAGAASLRSTSLNIVSVFRYEGAAGWQYIDGTSKYAFASNINNRGDVAYGESGAGVYFDGLGKFAVGSLLDPAVTGAGWSISGSGCLINDQRMVAAVAANSKTGQSGSVLLTPTGTLPPPTAPANLRGVAHAADSTQPWNSIDLTWENTSPLTQGYDLERSEAGQASGRALRWYHPVQPPTIAIPLSARASPTNIGCGRSGWAAPARGRT